MIILLFSRIMLLVLTLSPTKLETPRKICMKNCFRQDRKGEEGGQVVDGLQGGRDTILIRFLLHRLASPPPPLLLRYLHIDQLLPMRDRKKDF